MPVNYDRAVSRAAVFGRARNRDFEFDAMSSTTNRDRRYRLSSGNSWLKDGILTIKGFCFRLSRVIYEINVSSKYLFRNIA